MISLLIPVRNEEQNIAPLTHEIVAVMSPLLLPFEVIFVDDHSTDSTIAVINKTATEYPMVRLFSLGKEAGKDTALVKGMHEARGETVVTMDGDLQNDPSDIPHLLLMIEGYDMVCGIRRFRDDPVMKKAVSFIANRFRRAVAGGPFSDAGCAFRCMRRSCIAIIDEYSSALFGSAHYFYPDLVESRGGRVMEMAVKHRSRRYGKTKFNLMAGRVSSGIRACLAVRKIRRSCC